MKRIDLIHTRGARTSAEGQRHARLEMGIGCDVLLRKIGRSALYH